MAKIDEPIAYNWKLGWSKEHMSTEYPIVNRLIAAMLDKNIQEMKRLFAQGATIENADEGTFERALYFVMDDYQLVELLLTKGLSQKNPYFSKTLYIDECIDETGYFTSLFARAWMVGAYDVMELLASHGIADTHIHYKNKRYNLDEQIFMKDDIKTLIILLENGYLRSDLNDCMSQFPDSKLTEYLNTHPVVRRKSNVLDRCRFGKIPEPYLEKPGFFNRKKVEKKNNDLMADYYDRIRAQKEFYSQFSQEELAEIYRQDKEAQAIEDAWVKRTLSQNY